MQGPAAVSNPEVERSKKRKSGCVEEVGDIPRYGGLLKNLYPLLRMLTGFLQPVARASGSICAGSSVPSTRRKAREDFQP